jgi:thiol-disulfide isomerase/thioredoxin
MNEAPEDRKQGKRGGRTALLLVAGVVLLGAGAGVLYATRGDQFKGEAGPPPEKSAAAASQAKSELARFATGPLAKMETPATLNPVPATAFTDAAGQGTSLQAFKGQVAVVNVWATWCAPCVVEMPTLAALQGRYSGRDLKVVAISVDRDRAKADAFLQKHQPLELFHDPKMSIPFALTKRGELPQTVIVDRQGRIRATYHGDTNWNDPQVHRLLDALLAEPA